MVQAMKQDVFTVTAESLSRYADSYNFKIGKIGHSTTLGNIFVFIYTICSEILADSEAFDEFTMKLCIRRTIIVNNLATTNLLKTAI